MRFTFCYIVKFFPCGIYSADIRDFLQLDNPRNASINLEEDEEEDAVGAVVRCHLLFLNILEDYCDLCINQINGLKGFWFWNLLYHSFSTSGTFSEKPTFLTP